MDRTPVGVATLRWRSAVLLACVLPFAACQTASSGRAAPAPAAHEGLDASLWVKTAAEYVASAEQAYRLARLQLDEGLKPENAEWTAAVEQTENYAHLPPAVILDIDDAVLSTSPFQIQIVAKLGEFQVDPWMAWARQAEAQAVPGALGFVRYAESRGVRVMYLTNRHHAVEDATRKNLEALGFRVDPDGGNLLTKGEDPDWDSEKVERRELVASMHRVVLMVGDDMNDFIAGGRTSSEERVALASRYRDYWGTKWILLPNPVYGDWERSLYGFEADLTREERLQKKREALDSGE